MVPNLSKGAGIKGAALYVLGDKGKSGEGAIDTAPGQPAHRVGMTATRNLSTDDPGLAWRLMCATAANQNELKKAAGVRLASRQTKNFCGHIALSWEHETKPDRAEMLHAAEGALTALGWEKCQALIVEHKDHEHSHCHIVVCLIDPETGRTAPNTKNDYDKLQRWAHEYDKARGIEVCPNRAERMERAADTPEPPRPDKRWLSRKEYEAIRAQEREEHRNQAVDRYRAAAADVREQFRPEWAALYKDQRAELKASERDQARVMRALDRATGLRRQSLSDFEKSASRGIGIAQQSGLIDFYNQHRELIWRGIPEADRPGNTHTLLTRSFLQGAIERAHTHDRELMLTQHERAKSLLQERHTEARQDAYRAAWQRPAISEPAPAVQPANDAPAAPSESATPRAGLGAALAIGAAGIAAYVLSRSRDRDPQRDLDQAAERITRQQARPANTNRPQAGRVTEAPKQPEEPERAAGGDNSAAKPPRNELDALRTQVEARRRQIAREHAAAAAARAMERGFDRERSRD